MSGLKRGRAVLFLILGIVFSFTVFASDLDVFPETGDDCIDQKDLAFVLSCYESTAPDCARANVTGTDNSINEEDYNTIYSLYSQGTATEVCAGFSCSINEICNDNIDNDCDGIAEDGCPGVYEYGGYLWYYGDKGQSCDFVCNSKGLNCLQSNWNDNGCNVLAHFTTCSKCDPSNWQQAPMKIGSACYSRYDTIAQSCSSSSSTASRVCACSACTPGAEEVCNFLDDDCDGVADEDIECLTDCVESDGGEEPFTYGEATGYSISPVYKNEVISLGDSCLTENSVYEKSCKNVDYLIDEFTEIGSQDFLDTVNYYKAHGVQELVSWKEVQCEKGCNEDTGECIKPTYSSTCEHIYETGWHWGMAREISWRGTGCDESKCGGDSIKGCRHSIFGFVKEVCSSSYTTACVPEPFCNEGDTIISMSEC